MIVIVTDNLDEAFKIDEADGGNTEETDFDADDDSFDEESRNKRNTESVEDLSMGKVDKKLIESE